SSGRTVVRGGVGVFVNPHPLFSGPVDTVLNSADFPSRVVLSRSEALALNLKFPTPKDEARRLLSNAASVWGTSSVDANFPNPYSAQWTFGLQRELTRFLAMETAYVANRGIKLSLIRQMNYPDRVTGLRPVDGFTNFAYYDTSATSTFNSWQ